MSAMRWALALLMFWIGLTASWAAASNRPTVLVLMSYHQNYAWEKDMLEGIESVWSHTDQNAPHLLLEWMDTKQHADENYKNYFKQFFGQKYAGQQFDLVIAGDDNALAFISDHPEWFEKSPVVYGGINGDPFSILRGRPNTTGVLEHFDFIRTYELALKLHPLASEMIIISNNNETARGVLNYIHSDLRHLKEQKKTKMLTVKEWRGLSIDDLESRLKSVDANKTLIFFFGAFWNEKDNALMDPSETAAFIRSLTQAPIYSDTDSTLGSGVVGGYFNDGQANGVLMAQMAKRILDGDSVRSVPVVTTTPYTLAFDSKELKRFDISPNLLPKDAIIINRSLSLFDTAYRPFLLGSLIAVLILFVAAAIFAYIARTESRQRQALLTATLKDELTGLKNRRSLALSLKNLAAQQHLVGHVALIVFGLNRFKMINDSYGHAVGDELLQAVANRVLPLLDQHGELGRFSGDVFSIVYHFDSEQMLEDFLSRLEHIFAIPFALDSQHLVVKMSCGVSVADLKTLDHALLIREAETAMHTAKKNNVVRCHYEQYMHANNTRDREIEEMLPEALRSGAITVDFQAVRNIDQQCTVGYEALARWRHSPIGFVSPVDFVRVATESGQMSALTRYILRLACTEFKNLLTLDSRLYLAVNVSVGDLYGAHFCQILDETLQETNFPANQLVLEVTEDMSLNNVDVVRSMLDELRQRGIRVSIDDFGTGYSSMRYLSSYTINTLKIDRSFVQDILENESNQKIVRAVVSMASDLGVSVITEGVETMDQVRLLRRLGCVCIQGYVFSRPQPLASCLEQLRRDLNRAIESQPKGQGQLGHG